MVRHGSLMAAQTTEDKGNYIVRVSGYSNFALQPLPEAGATGDINSHLYKILFQFRRFHHLPVTGEQF